MLHAGKNAAYTYVFAEIMPALAIVTFAITDNNMIIGKSLKKIVSEAAYTALILILAQARNSLVDLMTA
jgi:hypothetical protein